MSAIPADSTTDATHAARDVVTAVGIFSLGAFLIGVIDTSGRGGGGPADAGSAECSEGVVEAELRIEVYARSS